MAQTDLSCWLKKNAADAENEAIFKSALAAKDARKAAATAGRKEKRPWHSWSPETKVYCFLTQRMFLDLSSLLSKLKAKYLKLHDESSKSLRDTRLKTVFSLEDVVPRSTVNSWKELASDGVPLANRGEGCGRLCSPNEEAAIKEKVLDLSKVTEVDYDMIRKLFTRNAL